MYLVKSRSEVCSFFGISTTTLRNWLARGMPGKSGQWDLQAIFQWKIARIREEQEKRGIVANRCPHCDEPLS